MIRVSIITLFLLQASACSSFSYYGQAIRGHLSLLAHSQPIDEVIGDEEQTPDLREHLKLARSIILFAEQEMKLPRHGSYDHFVKVPGRYVVWNVVAAPSLSIEARQWCYPFAGCVTYRGYYDEQEARAFAQQLASQGMDTTVAGASAYSTLGWLDDPLFSSMMYRSEARLVEVIIHELAHQRLYIKGNTIFNESFASLVAREGVRRWFIRKGKEERFQLYLDEQSMDRRFNELLLEIRTALKTLYASDRGERNKLDGKQEIFARLQQRYDELKQQGLLDDRYDTWMGRSLNNADLALVAAYHQMEPELAALLTAVDGDMERFYQQARELGEARTGA